MDPDAVTQNISSYINQHFSPGNFLPWLGQVFFALVILAIGWYVTKIIMRMARGYLERAKIDATLSKFLLSLLNATLLIIVVIMALNQLGVNTTSLIALLGAAGLAIGLALQDSLQNLAAGILIIVQRPFSADDLVEIGGILGVVKNVGVFSTDLTTPDNRVVIVPNGQIFTAPIINYSTNPIRRIDMVIGVGYNDDIRQAKALLEQIVTAHPGVLDDPPPVVAVGELADSSVNFHVRPWVDTSQFLDVKYDLIEAIKVALDENGFTIPYPQMDVHVEQ
jgi:small conductance mechanosensitive channel